MSVIIFTSCVEPNNNILVSRNTNRKIEVIANIKSFYENKCHHFFDQVILIDCSINPQVSEELFKEVRKLTGNLDIIFYHIVFSTQELNDISLKGKGFSELLMLTKAINQIPIINQNIVKISARYKPKSWRAFLDELKLSDESKRVKISFSKLRGVALTYAFSITNSALSEFDEKYRNSIDDRAGCYIEHNFYKFLSKMHRSDVERVYIQKYFNHITSGSTGIRPGFLKSLARNIVYYL